MGIGLGELDFGDLETAPRAGVFAFDYTDESGYGQYAHRQPYRLIGLPETAVTADQLSAGAQSFLAAVRFRDACFATGDSLVVEDTFESFHRPTLWD